LWKIDFDEEDDIDIGDDHTWFNLCATGPVLKWALLSGEFRIDYKYSISATKSTTMSVLKKKI
jgi:hypothetical protein